MFYSDARQLLYPGVARAMAEGWETARRRTAGNDYVVVTLAGPARLHYVDLDTGYFLGNAPGWVRISARHDNEGLAGDPAAERGVARIRAQPVPAGQPDDDVTAVRVDVYPDGGFSRLHLFGELAPAGARPRPSRTGCGSSPRPPTGTCSPTTGSRSPGSRDLSTDQLLQLTW